MYIPIIKYFNADINHSEDLEADSYNDSNSYLDFESSSRNEYLQVFQICYDYIHNHIALTNCYKNENQINALGHNNEKEQIILNKDTFEDGIDEQ